MNDRSITQLQEVVIPTVAPLRCKLLQRNGVRDQHTVVRDERAKCRNKQINLQRRATNQTDPTIVRPVVQEALRLPGQSLDPATRTFIEPRFGEDFSRVPITISSLTSWLPQIGNAASTHIDDAQLHYPSPLADSLQARALTINGNIHLGTDVAHLPDNDLRALLAHESVHVAQQKGRKRRSSLLNTEMEAHQLATDVLAGRPIKPLFSHDPAIPLTDTPRDRVVVAQARQRLVLLRRYLDERATREGRRLRMGHQGRVRLLEQRRAMDQSMPVLVPPETYEQIEETHLTQLNRRPLGVEVAENTVRFRVRFHVRFEALSASEAAAQFPTLRSNFLAGIRLIWNQRLQGMPLAGRRFELIPDLVLVSATAARNQNYWLVTVRPTDSDPMIYEGQSLGTTPGIPTSVTDPTIDGGVMSIPPSHIDNPDVLGHEVLHLFGLVDRYMAQTQVLPSGERRHANVPLRATGGRRDPLGAEEGPILTEDLNYLFERLGVYEMEKTRGLSVLRRIEQTEGLSYGQIIVEIHRLEEIIRLGRDPRSLIRIRPDFRDRMLRDLENIP